MQARLKVLHDKANVKQVKLLPVTLIGRSTDCNLKIASSQVSRNHCRITLSEDTVFVEDLGSANGTLVDGQALPPHQPTAVAPGARLLIGSAEFLIDYVAPTSTTMVLSRTGSRHAPDLAPTEVIYPVPAPNSDEQTFHIESAPVPATVAAAIPEAAAVAKAAAVPTDVPKSAKPATVKPATANPAAVAAVAVAAVAVEPSLSVAVPATLPPAPSDDLTMTDVAASAESHDVSAEDTVSDFNFGEAVAESVASESEAIDETMFAFEESSPAPREAVSAPVDSTPKKGGLKSLFSLFGKKGKPEGKSDAVAPSLPPAQAAPPAVFLPTLESPATEIPKASASPAELFIPEIEAPAVAEEDSPPPSSETTDGPDDGFQQFLQQF